MARRRPKQRATFGGLQSTSQSEYSRGSNHRVPKSMVIRMGAGDIGSSITQLVKDVRLMMEPHTASRLKVRPFDSTGSLTVLKQKQERRANRLRDYTTMAGPLGVSHLLLFSRSETGNLNLRVALTPRGPTLHFRVETYSLCKDIRRTLRHAKSAGKEYVSPPLLVMNKFVSSEASGDSQQRVPKHLETLVTSIFQSLFPPISPQDTPLSSIRRVLLLDRETSTSSSNSSLGNDQYTLNLRHFAITTKRTGLSRGVRKLDTAENLLNSRKSQQRLPDLGKLTDVADYLLDPTAAGGYTSGSDSEVETDAEVELLGHSTKVLDRKKLEAMRASTDRTKRPASRTEKRAIKLVELGPRLKLRMVKVEEGLCNGKVIWHDHVTKSAQEEGHLEALWAQRRKDKEERRREQIANVERKKRGLSFTGQMADDVQPAESEIEVDPAEWSNVEESDDDDIRRERVDV